MEETSQRAARQRLAYQMRMLRSQRGWSQETLAEVAGLHRTYISGIERAERNVAWITSRRLQRRSGCRSASCWRREATLRGQYGGAVPFFGASGDVRCPLCRFC